MWKRRGNMGHPVFLRLSISQSATPHWTSKGGHKGPCHYTWGCAHLHDTGMSQKAPQIFRIYSQSCCWGLSASWGRNPGFGGPPDAEVAGRSGRREPCSGYTRLSYHVCEAAEVDPQSVWNRHLNFEWESLRLRLSFLELACVTVTKQMAGFCLYSFCGCVLTRPEWNGCIIFHWFGFSQTFWGMYRFGWFCSKKVDLHSLLLPARVA